MDTLDRILHLIAKKGLTDRAFQKALGLKEKTVDNWKRGMSKSYLNHIAEIAIYFDVSADYLFGLKDE